MTKIIKNNIVLICLVSLFMFFNFKFGVKYVEDSPGYIEGYRTRSVLYPFLVQISCLFDRGSCFFLVFFQNILGACSIFILSEYYSRRFQYKYVIEKCVTIIFLFMPWIYFLYGENLWITNVILTEGVTYSLFYIFLFFVQKYIDDKKKSDYFASFGLATLLALIRIQFVYLYIVILLLFCFKNNGFSKENVKKMIYSGLILVTCIVVILIGKAIYFIYFPVENEEITHYDCNLVVNFVGISDGESKFQDSYDEEIYKVLYDELKENDGLFLQYKEKYRIPQISYKYSEEYDRLSFVIVKPVLSTILEKIIISEGVNRDEATVYLKDSLRRVEVQCLKDNLATYFEMYILRVFEGLGRMVSAGGSYAWAIAIVLYIVMGIALNFNRNNKKILHQSLIFGAVSVMNCFVVSVMIDPSDRYVIYGMGLFYLLLWFLLKEKVEENKMKINNKNISKEEISK